MKKDGGIGVDVLSGNDDYDWFNGKEDNDIIKGRGGDDYLVGDSGLDAIDGGDGNDVIFGYLDTRLDPITGALTNPLISEFDTQLFGGGGNDIVFGFGKIDGGDGDDILMGGQVGYSDGGKGNDIIFNGAFGGAGDDTYIITKSVNGLDHGNFHLGSDRYVISGDFVGDANLGSLYVADTIDFSHVTGINSVQDIEDRMTVTGLTVTIYIDSDTTIKFSRPEYPFKNDLPHLTVNKTDVGSIIASINARLDEQRDTNFQSLSSVGNSFVGTGVKDVIFGNGGKDSLDGGGGNDVLDGGASADTVRGGAGNDKLSGGADKDTLYGGADMDTFVFNLKASAGNVDTIKDFSHKDDTIALDDAVMTKLSSWSSAKFYSSASGKAHDASDRIIYDNDSGKLYYDADGNKAHGVAAIQFATLSSHPKIDWTDFTVI